MEAATDEGVRAELRVGGEPVWHVLQVAIDERLSGPATAWVEVEDGDGEDAHAGALLGRSAELVIYRAESPETTRRFCGVVREVERRFGTRRFRARVEPGFACLDEQRLTRPFVRLSALEILRGLLGPALAGLESRQVDFRLAPEAHVHDGADRCDDGFVRRPLCVQYDETTYAFCCRLLAEEGLAFLYDHDGPLDRLVIVESGQLRRLPEPVPVAPRSGLEARAESVFALARALGRAHGQPARRALDLRDPLRREAAPPGHGTRHGHDGGPRLTGSGDMLAFAPGQIFTLAAPPDELAPGWPDLIDGDLLLTHARHVADLSGREAAAGEGRHGRYENSFECVPAPLGFRPPLIPKPRAVEDWGIVVSGNDGDPIDADPGGGVRVRFIYDRRAQAAAAERSCWVPVSQAWAGAGFGVQILPRDGMLARIEYMFGDPDWPIVADCFPTGENVVPAALPDLKSRLTLRTHALRDQAQDDLHWNELALDDAAGTEEVWLRAGRDVRRRVLHDEHVAIDHQESRVVGGHQSLRVTGSRDKAVDGGEAEHVGGSRTAGIGVDDERTVAAGEGQGDGGADDMLEVDGRQEITLASRRSTLVEQKERVHVDKGRTQQVKGDVTLAVSGARTSIGDGQLWARQGKSAVLLAGSDASVTPEHALAFSTDGGELSMVPKGKATLTLSRLELRCGSSQVTIGDGKIAVKAATVVARGAKGQIKLDAQGAATVGKDVTSSAVVLNEIQGLPVIFSDSAGSAPASASQKITVQTAAGTASTLEIKEQAREPIDFQAAVVGPDRQPARNAAYRLLTPAGEILTGKTDGNGQLKVKLAPDTIVVDGHFTPEGRSDGDFQLELDVQAGKPASNGGTK